MHERDTVSIMPILVYSESLNLQLVSALASGRSLWMGLVEDKPGYAWGYGATYRMGDLWTVSPKRLEMPDDTCPQ